MYMIRPPAANTQKQASATRGMTRFDAPIISGTR